LFGSIHQEDSPSPDSLFKHLKGLKSTVHLSAEKVIFKVPVLPDAFLDHKLEF
jgi:hypothetical protein